MIIGTAMFSPCGLYRYTLTRTWAENYPPITWILLNPSKADAQVNDNTVSRVFDFSMRWGHGRLTVCNIFALRSTDPRALYKAEDPIGPENNQAIANACAGTRVILAWGVHGMLRGRDLRQDCLEQLQVQSRAAVCRIAGPTSVYAQHIDAALKRKIHDGYKCYLVVGVLKALRADIMAGYLNTLTELVHGELFGDFLEMADHLLNEGYKDAAAVIASGALEGHLRQVCKKHGVPIEVSGSTGTKPKKADQMNNELANGKAYSKLDQKNVTAWLDLRNKAAHGEYGLYTKDQVALFLSGVRDFITRIPA